MLASSTVLPAYRAKTAMLGMKWRVMREKLTLVDAIKRQEDGVLAKEVLEHCGAAADDGLAREVEEICPTFQLRNWIMKAIILKLQAFNNLNDNYEEAVRNK